jgi:ribosomal-protein-alanine N-acetyltransferase
VASLSIQLRSYQPTDFETLYRLHHACFPKGIAYGRFELRVYLCSDVSYCLIAEAAREIVGFILTEMSADEGHIITLDVLGSCRRKGIGSKLLAAAEKETAARGGKCMILETATTNNAAIALWEKHGYRQAVTIEEYYGPGLDAFQMRKDIAAARDASAG